CTVVNRPGQVGSWVGSAAATSACWSHVCPRGSATSADWVPHVYVVTTSAADVAEGIYNPPAESKQRPCG
nr:hypothetical protein [Tanacetum cinerariifolium]